MASYHGRGALLALTLGACAGGGGSTPICVPLEPIAIPSSSHAGGLSLAAFRTCLSTGDGDVTFTRDGTTTRTAQTTPYGVADVTVISAHADGITRETDIYALADPPETYVVQHVFTFSTDTSVVSVTPFSADVDAAGTRLYYGPADDTVYMIEDYLAIPAVDGWSKPGSMLQGGVPLDYAWNRAGGVAVGVITDKPGTYALPLAVSGGRITLAETYAPSAALKQKSSFAPGESFASDVVFVTYHAGDYFAPLDRYTRLLDRVSGRHIQNADASAPAFARRGYWKTWGLDPAESGKFTKTQVRQIATQLPGLGIHWILLDWGWFTAEGNWDPNPDVFTDENDLRAFIAELKVSGFHVGLWFQPLQLDPTDQVVKDTVLAYSVENEDGSKYLDDDDLALADPSLGPVQSYLDTQLARFADLGVEHVYLDSQVAQLATPPDFALASPLASHEALPGVYDRIRAFGKQHGMVIEICPDGRSQSILDVPQDVNNIGDPKNDRQLRAEFKSLKAILGPRAIVGAYVDPFPDNQVSGSFLNVIALGGMLETMFRQQSDLGAASWAAATTLYAQEDIVSGVYQDLYDIGFDYPEAHAVKKGTTMYYSFFTDTEGLDACMKTVCSGGGARRPPSSDTGLVTQIEAPRDRHFAGALELRGLAPGASYQVRRWPAATATTVQSDATGRAVLAGVEFDKEVLFIVTPT